MHQGISGTYFQALSHAQSRNTNFISKGTPSLLGDTNKVAGGWAGSKIH